MGYRHGKDERDDEGQIVKFKGHRYRWTEAEGFTPLDGGPPFPDPPPLAPDVAEASASPHGNPYQDVQALEAAEAGNMAAPAAWTPRTPPDKLVRRLVADTPAWRAYLVGLGYAPAELPSVLHGQATPPASRGLIEAAEVRVAELERTAAERGQDLDPDEVAQARAGAVRSYLGAYPPARSYLLDRRPEPFLASQAFGRRLVPVGAAPGRGQVLEDMITARRWWTVGEPGDLAGLPVVAGALYRLVGVAAPAARLAQLEDGRRAVHPQPEAWEPLDARRLELHRSTLSGELPADAWLGWAGGTAQLRARLHAMPAGMAATLRLGLDYTLGRAGSRPAPRWGVDAPDLAELLAVKPWAGLEPRAMIPLAERLARVTDAQVRRAVALGQLEDGGRLTATLIARRDKVARDVLDLATGRPGTR